MRSLLDVNVLVSLTFPDHSSHLAAQKWFRKEPDRLQGTRTLTHAGFLRVNSGLPRSTCATSPSPIANASLATIRSPTCNF